MSDDLNFAALQKRIHFTGKQIDLLFDRLERMEKAIATHEEDLQLASASMFDFEKRIRELKSIERKESKLNIKKKLTLIANNLQSVERNLMERKPEPRPYIPPDAWQAFEEFLIKLKS